MTSIYLIGSLRNPRIPLIGNELRKQGYDLYDSWFGAGKVADDHWQEYSNIRGLSYKEALKDYSAQQVFYWDKHHLDRCDAAILVMPAGKSGHLELGYMSGSKKPTWIMFDQIPERYDCMYNFTTDVCFSEEELYASLRQFYNPL